MILVKPYPRELGQSSLRLQEQAAKLRQDRQSMEGAVVLSWIEGEANRLDRLAENRWRRAVALVRVLERRFDQSLRILLEARHRVDCPSCFLDPCPQKHKPLGVCLKRAR